MANPTDQTERHRTPRGGPVEREREVIVTNGDGGRSRSSVGALVMGILAVVAAVVLAVVLVNALGGSGSGESPVDVPSEVDVNVDPGGGDGGS